MIDKAVGRTLKVLIVAEDQLFAERCRRSLQAEGHSVSLAPGWWLGVQLAGREAPDLVVVDDGLADVDGLSVLAILKAHPSTAQLPVVVAATRERPELRERASRLGAVAIVLKSEAGGRLSSYAGIPVARSAVDSLLSG